ncbi:hypothetical protein [Flavobacterium pedocola]
MRIIIYLSLLLIAAIGYSQEKVSAKSNTPIAAVVVKMSKPVVGANLKKSVERNDITITKQSTPVGNRVVNYIGTPKTTYVESIAVVKKEMP